MIETVTHLDKAGMKRSVCIGIHAIFAGDAYIELKNAGVEKIVTTNSIPHETNAINVVPIFAAALSGDS